MLFSKFSSVHFKMQIKERYLLLSIFNEKLIKNKENLDLLRKKIIKKNNKLRVFFFYG